VRRLVGPATLVLVALLAGARRERARDGPAARGRGGRPTAAPDTWPHTVTGENGTATVYQPQVISWPEHKTLNARMVIGIAPPGEGPISAPSTSRSPTETRAPPSGRSSSATAASSPARFPSADPAQAARFEQRIGAGALGEHGRQARAARHAWC